MSLAALREIFRDVHPSSIPSDLAKCLVGNKEAITANQAAGREFEFRREQQRILAHFTRDSTPSATQDLIRLPRPHTVPSPLAIPDPTRLPLPHPASDPLPSSESHGPIVPLPSRPSAPPFRHSAPPHSQPAPQLSATVNARQTALHADLPLPQCPDPASQLCSDRSASVRAENRSSWDPQLLFPEIALATPPILNAPHQKSSNPQHQIPRRAHSSDRIKVVNNQKDNSASIDLDASDFLDVPLQYAEGRQLLTLIGASAVPIPPHLMASSLSPREDTDQSSTHVLKNPPRPMPKARKDKKKASSSKPPIAPKKHIEHTPKGKAPASIQSLSDRPGLDRPVSVLPLPEPTSEYQFSSTVHSQQAPSLPADAIAPTDNNFDEDDPYLDRVDYSDEEGLHS